MTRVRDGRRWLVLADDLGVTEGSFLGGAPWMSSPRLVRSCATTGDGDDRRAVTSQYGAAFAVEVVVHPEERFSAGRK